MPKRCNPMVNFMVYKRPFSRSLFLILFPVFLTAVCLSQSSVGAFPKANRQLKLPEEERNILILHSYHQGFEWSDKISKGISEVFNDRDKVNLFFEYLDVKRYSDPEYYESLLKLYEIKAGQIPIDVIITVDDAAFNFMLENGQRFYPGIPVVFCGVNKVDPTKLKGHDNFLGVEENVDHFGTLFSATKIFPDRKNVLVINDYTLTGNVNRQELEKVIPHFNNLNFEIFQEFTMQDIRDRIARLDQSWMIYLIVLNRDKNGTFITYNEGINQIRQASSVPIFGSFDFYENKGIFGGKITRAIEQGRYAAGIAKEILYSGKIPDIPQFQNPEHTYSFDYHEVKRFNVSVSQLPPNSIITNKPEKNAYFLKIAAVLVAVFFLVSVSLIFLLRSRRKKALALKQLVDEKTKQLRIKNSELLETIDTKNKFFSILAHDLINQLGTIHNMNLMLCDEENDLDDTARKKILHAITSQTAGTYGLLEDLLYWGRMQFKKEIFIKNKSISLYELVEELLPFFKINLNHVELVNQIEKGVAIDSDEFIIKFILRNLIQNGIKYSHKNGKVEIGSYPENNFACITIRDYGIGMTEKVIESIRSGKPEQTKGTKGQGSTGLGLSAVMDYLNILNGELLIRSEPGKGSLFTVKFPQQTH